MTGITTAPAATGRIVISGLRRGTAGYEAGFNVDDEVIAVNGYRVRAEQWPSRLDNYKPGTVVDVLVARRDKLMTVQLPIVAEKAQSWQLEARSDASEEQKARLKAWVRE